MPRYKLRAVRYAVLAGLFFVSASPVFEGVEKIYGCLALIIFASPFIRFRVQAQLADWIMLGASFMVLLIWGWSQDIVSVGAFDLNALGFFFCFAIGFFIASNFSKQEALDANEKLVIGTLLIGLPIYFVVLFGLLPVSSFAEYNYGRWTHRTIFVTNFLLVDGYLSTRFVGFGSEPGLSQIFFLLALVNRLRRKKIIDLGVVLIILGIYFGKSTSGLVGLMLVLLMATSAKTLLVFGMLSLAFLPGYIEDVFIYHLENKLVGSESFEGRYGRYGDFISANLYNILFGYGNAYYSSILATTGIGGWDSFLQVGQRYGIIWVCILIFSVLYNNRRYMVASLVIILGFFSQAIWLMPAIAIFYFKGMEDKGQCHGNIDRLQLR